MFLLNLFYYTKSEDFKHANLLLAGQKWNILCGLLNSQSPQCFPASLTLRNDVPEVNIFLTQTELLHLHL